MPWECRHPQAAIPLFRPLLHRSDDADGGLTFEADRVDEPDLGGKEARLELVAPPWRRGGDPIRVTLTGLQLSDDDTNPSGEVIALDDALSQLARQDPRQAEMIELHYFGGMTYEEIAAASGVSRPTVTRDLRMARAWLRRALTHSAEDS